jgi:hypothetical protein
VFTTGDSLRLGSGQREVLTAVLLDPTNPILHEIRGFTYTHIQKAVFPVIENPFFQIFFIRWAFFKTAFLAVRDHDQSPGFIPLALGGTRKQKRALRRRCHPASRNQQC